VLKMRQLMNAKAQRPVVIKAKGKGRGKGKGKTVGSVKAGNEVAAWLTQDVDIQSAANTPYTTAFGVTPSSCGEFPTYAALYDEYKCVEAKFCFKNALLASPSANQTLCALAYDELNNVARSSVANCCEARQHFLWGQSFNTATGTVIPQDVDRNGLWTFNIKVPRGVAIGSTLSQTGETWTATSVTGVQYGYVVPYLEALGGTGISRLRGILYQKVIFRCRI